MEEIKQLIYESKIEQAIALLNEYIEVHSNCEEAYYQLGNAYRKKGDNRQAMNNYLKAMEINPDSPARQAYNMLIDILNFYHKDRYNH